VDDRAYYLYDDNFDRDHHGRKAAGRHPADLVYGAYKMDPGELHLSAHLGVCAD
jgi:hypothetical protein